MPIYKTSVKKDGLQQYRVRVNYTDSSGQYKQIERIAYGKPAAVELEQQIQNEVKGNQPDYSQMTVRELYDEYMESKKHDVRVSTYEKSKSILTRNILPAFGDYSIGDLTGSDIQKWKNNLNNTDLSLLTKQNIYGELRTMLNYAVRLEYIPKSPLFAVSNFKEACFTPIKEKMQYYTPEQFQAFIVSARAASVTQYDWGIYVFFCIAYYTGMRKGEINALKWSDIQDNIIHVRRSVAQKIAGRSVVETPPKNKSSYRTLQMPIPLIEILDQHKQRQQQDLSWCEEYRVCGGASCISDTALSNHNREFANAAGLPHIRIHDFRHSHATLLANEGINIQEIARRLGHANVQQTWQTYSHLYPREEERAVKILNKIKIV